MKYISKASFSSSGFLYEYYSYTITFKILFEEKQNSNFVNRAFKRNYIVYLCNNKITQAQYVRTILSVQC